MSGFQDRVNRARQQELLTTEQLARRKKQQEEAATTAKRNQYEDARLRLERVWTAVARAIADKSPPPDDIVATSAGAREWYALEHSPGAQRRIRRGKRPYQWQIAELNARQEAVLSRSGQPAWDMIEGIELPNNRVEGQTGLWPEPMFLGADGTIYTNLGRKWGEIRSANGVKLASGWQPGHKFDARDRSHSYPEDYERRCYDRIEQGLANLVAKYSLTVDV
jgi:hypothetical protein